MQTVMKTEKQEIEGEVKAVELPGIKQMVRYIAKFNKTNVDAGYDAMADVDAELSVYYSKGYRLVLAHFLGENPEGYGMFYVLQLQ